MKTRVLVLRCLGLLVLTGATACSSSDGEARGGAVAAGGGAPDAKAPVPSGGASAAGGGGGSVAGSLDSGAPDSGKDTGPALPSGSLLLLDQVHVHDTTDMAFSFFDVATGVPDDLTPYVGGRLYQRVEVETKPSSQGVSYQMCLFQDEHTSDKHACTDQMAFTEPGSYETEQELASLWQYSVIDLSRALLDLMLVVKDSDGDPVDTRYGFDGPWEGSPDLSLYYPMKVRYRAVLAPPGVAFAWPK